MAVLSYTDLRKGVVFTQGSETFIVLKYEHVKQGRGSATVKVKVKNVRTGAIFVKSLKAGDKVESADVTKESAQYLYADDANAYFMNMHSYEQFTVSLDVLGEKKGYLKEGAKAIIQKLEGTPIDIELPKKVELEVEYTEPAVVGNTSSGATKIAKLETGLEVNVPLFVNIGDVLIINTELNSYVSRR